MKFRQQLSHTNLQTASNNIQCFVLLQTTVKLIKVRIRLSKSNSRFLVALKFTTIEFIEINKRFPRSETGFVITLQ